MRHPGPTTVNDPGGTVATYATYYSLDGHAVENVAVYDINKEDKAPTSRILAFLKSVKNTKRIFVN